MQATRLDTIAAIALAEHELITVFTLAQHFAENAYPDPRIANTIIRAAYRALGVPVDVEKRPQKRIGLIN